MRKIVFILVSLFLLGFTACQKTSSEDLSDLLSIIPPKTALILKVENLPDFVEELQTNSFISANSDFPLHNFLEEAYHPITQLDIAEPSLLTFSNIGRDKIGTTLMTPTAPKLLDSIGYEQIDGFKYNGEEVKKYTIDGKKIFGVKLKDFFVFGDSKLVIENMIRLSKHQFEPNENLTKVYKSSSDRKPIILLNTSEFKKLYKQILPNSSSTFLDDFTNWVALDLDVRTGKIQFNGISLPERKEILGLFKGTTPNENDLAKITPISARGFYSFTYDDFSTLEDNISFYRKDVYPTINTDILESASEIGIIYGKSSNAVALNSKFPEETKEYLENNGAYKKTHRQHKIYSFSEPDYFYKALHPLINTTNLQFYTVIENFFVFAEEESYLENIISNVQNKTVFTARDAYKNSVDDLDSQSSILLVGATKNLLKEISNGVREKNREAYEQTEISNYHFGAFQFINHSNFTYLNGIFSESNTTGGAGGGIQIESIKPGEEIIAGPWFFENWRTHHYDIAFQGKSNTLYVYDENGKQHWKKQLSGKIIGDIQPIDIYQNKRKQMAFVTSHTLYIIDREGNIVKPFNKTFDKTITQPLSIFDYDKNGRFRFLIIQDNNVSMFDKQLNSVKGFEFSSAKSTILHPPKHFRLAHKDYIIIPEKSGQLHILNRRGQTRVKVNEDIDFSDNEWYIYNSKFTSTNSKGELIQIDTKGNIQKENLKLDKDHRIAATGKTLVTFSGNKMTIKGKSTSLDYGLYQSPEIFYLNNKIYVSITDLQAHRVYLFDSNSKSFSGFPVYGNSKIDLQDMNNREETNIIVKGEDDSILIYGVQ